jgi:hypothetical protein
MDHCCAAKYGSFGVAIDHATNIRFDRRAE